MTIQVSVKTFKPMTVHSVLSLVILSPHKLWFHHFWLGMFTNLCLVLLLLLSYSPFSKFIIYLRVIWVVTYRLLCINRSLELVLYSSYRSCKTCESLNGEKLERSSGNGRTYLQIRVRVISELHHNRLSINSPGHRQFCLYHFRWYYWSRTLYLAIFLLAAMRRQNRIEKISRANIDLFISVLQQILFATDMSPLFSRPAMCRTYTYLLKFYLFPVRHLVEGTEWWNNMFTLISSAVSIC